MADASTRPAAASAQFQATVQRAYVYAEEQAHRHLTTEHLLLALTEDVDAVAVLQRRSINLDHIRNEIAGLVSRSNDRFAAHEQGQPAYSPDLVRVLNIAGSASSPRRPIDGALMLAALIADGTTPAAELVKLYGLTFDDASRGTRPVAAATTAPSLATVRTNAREAALGFRLRGGAAGDAPLLAGRPPLAAAQPVDRPPPLHVVPDDNPARGRVPPDAPPQQQPAEWTNGYDEAPPRTAPAYDRTYAAPAGEANWKAAADTNPVEAGAPDWSNYSYPEADAPGYGPPGSEWPEAPLSQQPPYRRQASQVAAAGPLANRPPRGSTDGAMPKTRARRPAGKSSRASSGQGLLIESLPSRIPVGKPYVIEARMARHGIQAALNDLRNSGMQLDPQDPITQAMTVRLRAPEGKVIVEAGTPETQWVESTLGLLQEDYASWRWTITPKWPGSAKLQFLVSVRTVSHNGLMAEAALPDQTIDVAGATNVLALLQKYAVWGGLLAGAIGIGVAAEHYLRVFNRLLGH